MSNEGLIASLLVLAVAALWIGAPLLRREKSKHDEALAGLQGDRLALLYERILTNIRDLDEDHSTGKMNVEDYQAEREEWVQRGVEVLKALDQLGGLEPLELDALDGLAFMPEAQDSDEDAIEAAIAAYRGRAKT